MHVPAEADRVFKRPGAIRVERDARVREALGDRRDGLDLLFAGQHAALQFEVGKAVMIMRSLGEPHDRFRCHRLLMPQTEPIDLLILARDIGKVGLFDIADEQCGGRSTTIPEERF